MKRRLYQATSTNNAPSPVSVPDLSNAMRQQAQERLRDDQRQQAHSAQQNKYMQQQALRTEQELKARQAELVQWGKSVVEDSADFFAGIQEWSGTAQKLGNYFAKQADENDKAMWLAKAMEDYQMTPPDTSMLEMKEGALEAGEIAAASTAREAINAGMPNYAANIRGASHSGKQVYISEIAKLHGQSYQPWLAEQFRSNDRQTFKIRTPQGIVEMTPMEAAQSHDPHLQAAMAAALRPQYFTASGMSGLDRDVVNKYFMPEGVKGEQETLKQLNKAGIQVRAQESRQQAEHTLYMRGNPGLFITQWTGTPDKSGVKNMTFDSAHTALEQVYVGQLQSGAKSKAQILHELENSELPYKPGHTYKSWHKKRYDKLVETLRKAEKSMADADDEADALEKKADEEQLLNLIGGSKEKAIKAQAKFFARWKTTSPAIDLVINRFNQTDMGAAVEVEQARKRIATGVFTEANANALSHKAQQLLQNDLQVWRARQDGGHDQAMGQFQDIVKDKLGITDKNIDLEGDGAFIVQEMYQDYLTYIENSDAPDDATKRRLAQEFVKEKYIGKNGAAGEFRDPQSKYYIDGSGFPNYFKKSFGGTRSEVEAAWQQQQNVRRDMLKRDPDAYRKPGYVDGGVARNWVEKYNSTPPEAYDWPAEVNAIHKLHPSKPKLEIFNEMIRAAGQEPVLDKFQNVPLIEGMTPEESAQMDQILNTSNSTGETSNRLLYNTSSRQQVPTYTQRPEYGLIQQTVANLPTMDEGDASAFLQYYRRMREEGNAVKVYNDATIPELLQQVVGLTTAYNDYESLHPIIDKAIGDNGLNPATAFAVLALSTGVGPPGIMDMSLSEMQTRLRQYGGIYARETGNTEALRTTQIRRTNYDPFFGGVSDASPSLGAQEGDQIAYARDGFGMRVLTPVPSGRLTYQPADYMDMAKIIVGEANLSNDDIFLVAGTLINRHTQGYSGATSIRDVGNQPGQYEAHKYGIQYMTVNDKHRQVAALLSSPEGQRKLIRALHILKGRTDFKGTSQYRNRSASDIQFGDKGNFAHYKNQYSRNDPPPSVIPLDWQRVVLPE
jgi:hypothetical protein